MNFLRTLFLAAVAAALTAPAMPAAGQAPPPNAIEIPGWFVETFLDFREDARDAAREGKRVLVYFGQDGCPYCRELMQTSFTQPRIVEKTRRNFVPVALNIWGDREVTWVDGKVRSEKAFARFMKVQFTPTILLLDEKGGVAARLNGYYPPHRFEAALDYAAQHLERKQAFPDYMRTAVKEASSETLHDEPFFLRRVGPQPLSLARGPSSKPLAVLFETRYCSGCDELHREGFQRPDIRSLLERFDVARLALGEPADIVTPSGARAKADLWARDLKITYTPSMVFFDVAGREAFRIEAYLRPFHLASALDYVSSGTYRREPDFQRYVQSRSEAMRTRGEAVDLWK